MPNQCRKSEGLAGIKRGMALSNPALLSREARLTFIIEMATPPTIGDLI